ncbi:MAG: glycosyltransferase family 2 protein [Chitinophagaceae bacterium]|nr:glycosyltransferase family 2 protein [Chitinophagaceae bacterium]
MFISICIPAYKNLLFLERLLNSIAVQTFKDFEVVITDDSPDDELRIFLENYQSHYPIQYYKNQYALGTPENWNEGIRKAKGEWIKIMHDDDWFLHENSLAQFASLAQANQNAFIFSAYQNLYLEEKRTEKVVEDSDSFRFKHLKKNVASLLSKNIIGPPSVIMHKNDGKIFYDKQLKWLVDIDFYVHRMKSDKIIYIDEPLINVGLSNEQVTKSCFRIADVEIPEYFYFMNKIGFNNLKNILVYDASWRLLRNLEIRNLNQLLAHESKVEIPQTIKSMIQFQNLFPIGILKIGLLSKMLMLIHYIFNNTKFKS